MISCYILRVLSVVIVLVVFGQADKVSAEPPFCRPFIIVNFVGGVLDQGVLAKVLEKALRGRIKFDDEIRIVDGRRTFSHPLEAVKLINSEIVDAVIARASTLATRVRDLAVLNHPDIPVAVRVAGAKAFTEWLQPALDPQLKRQFHAKLLGSVWFFNHIVSRKGKFSSIGELKGVDLNFDSPEAKVVLTELGANPVRWKKSEVYAAIRKGGLDGALLPFLTVKLKPVYEVVSLAGREGFLPVAYSMLVSQKLLAKAPESVAHSLLEAGRTTSLEFQKLEAKSRRDRVSRLGKHFVTLGKPAEVATIFSKQITPKLPATYKKLGVSEATIKNLVDLLARAESVSK